MSKVYVRMQHGVEKMPLLTFCCEKSYRLPRARRAAARGGPAPGGYTVWLGGHVAHVVRGACRARGPRPAPRLINIGA